MSVNADKLEEELEEDFEQRGPREEIKQKLRNDYLGLAGLTGLIVIFICAIVGPMLTPYDPLTPNYSAIQQAPSLAHPMGTDHLGRDIMSRVLLGARFSLAIGFFSIIFASSVGIIIGGAAGYTSKEWLDEILMRSMDVLMSIPPILLGIALVGIIGNESFSIGAFELSNLHLIIFVIGFVYMPRFARVTRGAVLKESSKAYVKMSRLEGASHAYIFTREIFINILPPVLVLFTYRIGNALILSAGLGFLGLGLTPPRPGWGVMISEGKDYILNEMWWMIVFPGLALALTIMAANFFGDAVRDALDPNVSTDEEV